MSVAPQQAPTAAQTTTTPSSNVSAAAVTTALQALKDVAGTTDGANGQTATPSDPQLVAALLRLIQSQKPVDQDKGAAAETLSSLSQSAGPNHHPNIHPQLQEAGPNSHPHGPPMLGVPSTPSSAPPPTTGSPTDDLPSILRPPRRRGGPPTVNGQPLNNEEWARQRKDNHKEVERRRRGNINEGINALAKIVPNGSGEKAKGAILSRAVQYIHHLKENEARNIEKWTLEKLLMDQAMGDLQAQLAEVREVWQKEVKTREESEAELAKLKTELSSTSNKKRPSESEEAEKSDKEEGSGNEREAKRPRSDA